MNKISLVQQNKTANILSSTQDMLQRKCACGNKSVASGECTECEKKKWGLQRKLAIGASNDPLEREADRVADQVMATKPPLAASGAPVRIQRYTGKAIGEFDAVPASVERVLSHSGRPLDTGLKQDMQSRFGHDFSDVRVHSNSAAELSARDVNANAYTVGHNIVFGTDMYAPSTRTGRRLLAHELTHVVQQSGAKATVPERLSPDSTPTNQLAQHSAFHSTHIQKQYKAVKLQRQTVDNESSSDGRPGCRVGSGIPNSNCSVYAANSWWLPFAYVNNASCACIETPNTPTARCVRKFLQVRMTATPGWLKALAATQKPLDLIGTPAYSAYQAFVQAFLTPRIYLDHRDAYASCCCPSGPAVYPAWVGVTSVPLPCVGVGTAIRYFGSCHGTPGAW